MCLIRNKQMWKQIWLSNRWANVGFERQGGNGLNLSGLRSEGNWSIVEHILWSTLPTQFPTQKQEGIKSRIKDMFQHSSVSKYFVASVFLLNNDRLFTALLHGLVPNKAGMPAWWFLTVSKQSSLFATQYLDTLISSHRYLHWYPNFFSSISW